MFQLIVSKECAKAADPKHFNCITPLFPTYKVLAKILDTDQCSLIGTAKRLPTTYGLLYTLIPMTFWLNLIKDI